MITNKNRKVLVADDEECIRLVLKELLIANQFEPILASDGIEALKLFNIHKPPICIIDIKMPRLNGLELLKEIKEIEKNTFIIIITAFADMENTIEAMKYGAYEFLKKPSDFDNEHILTLIKKAYSAYELVSHSYELSDENNIANTKPTSELCLIGKSPKMQEVYKTIGKISDSTISVLITGESGVGKEIIARVIHANSPRADKPFIAINCSAIPETLIESELFGHEKGAFTGAINKKIGKFELASSGTLFLDEVAEMNIEMQAKFLRVLQEKEIVRVGGNEIIKVDPRIIAATNVNLEEALVKGKLREDLYHRLKVVTIHVPPLRERREDIEDLVKYFIKLYNVSLNKNILNVSPEVMDFFLNYNWPGNVRELKNVIESAVAICRENTILLEHLPSEIINKSLKRSQIQIQSDNVLVSTVPTQNQLQSQNIDNINQNIQQIVLTSENEEIILKQIEQLLTKYINIKLINMSDIENTNFYDLIIDSIEKILLSETLKKFKGNQVKTAKFLGINRNTLRTKLKKYNLDELN